MRPLVTIIIPVYNAKKYLNKCLQSILRQSYKNLEIILVDDGSSDGSSQICDMYSEQDKRCITHHQKNMGVSAARNWALDNMHGEYILFVDSDDFIDDNLIAFCVDVAEKENADIVTFKYEEWERIDATKTHDYDTPMIDMTSNTASILKEIMLNEISNMVWTAFYKKNMWKNKRFSHLKSFEDLFICPSVFVESQKSVKLNNILYYYNKGNTNSLTGSDHTYNSQYRYYKYLAYKEHLRWAQKIGDMEVIHWAKYHMMYEAIKILYVDNYSSEKLCVDDKKSLIRFVKQSWTPAIKEQVGLKHRLLRWSAVSCPLFCKVYGYIRHQQEKAKQKL